MGSRACPTGQSPARSRLQVLCIAPTMAWVSPDRAGTSRGLQRCARQEAVVVAGDSAADRLDNAAGLRTRALQRIRSGRSRNVRRSYPHPHQDDRSAPIPDVLGMATTPSRRRWKAGDLLLHQSRSANKRSGCTAAAVTASPDELTRMALSASMAACEPAPNQPKCAAAGQSRVTRRRNA